MRCNRLERRGQHQDCGYPSRDDPKPARCYPRSTVATSRTVPGIGSGPSAAPREERKERDGRRLAVDRAVPDGVRVAGARGQRLILSLCLLPLAAAIILRRRLLLPRGFGLLLLFLLWCAFSAAELTNGRQASPPDTGSRCTSRPDSCSSTFWNTPRDRLRPDTAVRIMAALFVITVMGGLIGMAIPNSFTRWPRG